MAYVGARIPIALGQMGLRTDDPMTSIPPNAFIKANNISLYNSRVEKSQGSTKYNTTALDGAVVGLLDWFPTPSLQRLMAATTNGSIYRDTGDGTFTAFTPIKTGLSSVTTDAHFVTGGSELAGSPKKLFFFTGSNPVQVLTADGTSFANLANPSADWSTGQPSFGIVYQDRMIALGSGNNRHSFYTSTADDHEKFDDLTDSFVFNVFPGEADGLIGAIVYRGVLMLFKRPYGVYIVDGTQDPSPANWTVQRYSDAFGISSPHGLTQVLGDLFGGNNTGTVTSLQTTNAFGDFTAGDVLTNAQVENYFRQNLNPAGIPFQNAIYYPEKKVAMFTARGLGSSLQDRIIKIDTGRQNLRITQETKDNVNCLALRKDANKIQRPIYGDSLGFVYLMDQSTYNVGGNPYVGEFQTPYMDFSAFDGSLGSVSKLYDFIEIDYVATGAWNFYVDVYVDTVFKETLTVRQSVGGALDTFILDVDRLAGEGTRTIRLPLHGTGRNISFRFYNGSLNQNFIVERFIVEFRTGGEQQIR